MGIDSIVGRMNLGGYLLLASPLMRDPNFRRTAVILSTHDRDHGTHGLVLDRPAHRRVCDLVSIDVGPLGELPVYRGGPCETNQLYFALIDWELDGRGLVYLCPDLDQACLAREQGKRVRAFVGHSGWSPGQLEHELELEGWLVTPPRPDLFEQDFEPAGAWSGHLRGMGPEMSLMAHLPDDPMAN